MGLVLLYCVFYVVTL